MRTLAFLLFSLACVVFIGCTRSGDVGAFLVSEVAKHGGHTKTNLVLPKLDAQWTVKRDDNGFQALITGTSFTNIDKFMQQAFGTPKQSVEGSSTADGQPFRGWAAVDIGVAIQLVGRPDGAEVVCIKGVKDISELLPHISSNKVSRP